MAFAPRQSRTLLPTALGVFTCFFAGTRAQPLSTRSLDTSTSLPTLIGTIIGLVLVFILFALLAATFLRQRARHRANRQRAGIYANPAVRWAGAEMYARETSDRVRRARSGGSGASGEMLMKDAPPPAYGAPMGPPSYQAVTLGVPDRAVVR